MKIVVKWTFGGNAGKIAQNTLSPAILYLRGQNENPTLNSQSVQIQTDEETNPEMETITKQMNEDLDVINSIIDNPDAKSNEEQTQILQEQQDLMRELNTNITPVEEDDIVEEEVVTHVVGKKPLLGKVWKTETGDIVRYRCYSYGIEYKIGDPVFIESQRPEQPFHICCIQVS